MLKAFTHIAVAFSVFFSSGGFWINSHFCHNEFIKTNFLFSPESCDTKEVHSCSLNEKGRCGKEDHEEDKNCCHNRARYYKLDQYQQIPVAGIEDAKRVVTWHAIVPPFRVSLPFFNKLNFPYHHYTPPLIAFDRQVWWQTFLC
jgi:hypothetical protein